MTQRLTFHICFCFSGRDVALSSNQSPVLKFYRSTYADYAEREAKFQDSLWNVRAMQLWNDWNTQVYDWATRHTFNTSVSSDAVTVDYLWMRSEDLLPGSSKRLECLQALAEFVGSTLTPEQLCKLSQQDARDYGKSIEHKTLEDAESPANNITARWRDIEERKKKRSKKPQREKRQSHQGSSKRRLSEVTKAKIVPSAFIRDFETWRGLVKSEIEKSQEESKEFILAGLIGHGEDLRKQWAMNHFDEGMRELKEAAINKEAISVLLHQVQVKQQETRLFKHKQQEKMKQGDRRSGDPNVKKRYGKWQGVLSNNTELATYFYQEGARGLELFGYHPAKDIHYLSGDQELISDCDED
jgi:hypothetical protein